MTPLQRAVAVSAVDIFRDLIDRQSSQKFEDATIYEMNFIVPSTLTYCADEDNSCIESMAEHCSGDELAEFMSVVPLKLFLTKFPRIRTARYCIILALHIIYMSCFSAFVLPTCYNSTLPESNTAERSAQAKYVAFLVWPTFILIFELLCVIKYTRNVWKKNIWSTYIHIERQLRKQAAAFNNGKCTTDATSESQGGGTEDSSLKFFFFVLIGCTLESLMDTSFSAYIRYFQLFSHLSSVGFSILVITWLTLYSTSGDRSGSYIDVVAVIQIYGWMQTIDYVKDFSNIHAFVMHS